MKRQPHDDLSNLSMLELFRAETESQTALLTKGLLELEREEHDDPARREHFAPLLESLMRAAHSLKGAARIVNLSSAVRVAHAMEDCFVAAQQGRVTLDRERIDTLLRGVDLIGQISRCEESNVATWEAGHVRDVEDFLSRVAGRDISASQPTDAGIPDAVAPSEPPESDASLLNSKVELVATEPARRDEAVERVVRLNAENLNRLLGLAGESLVESRWMRPFSDSMQRLKRMQSDLERTLDGLKQSLAQQVTSSESGSTRSSLTRHDSPVAAQLAELTQRANEVRVFLNDRLQEFDSYDRRSAHLSSRLYLEVLRTRMRPFGDGTGRFVRMVRDLARSLGKQARLEILGENTQVDRDILERLETPLAHLLRNAVDHGCETPEQRKLAGKPPEAVIQLEARHSAGMLLVTVSDDGGGIDSARLRQAIIQRKLTTPSLAEKMSEAELLEFLFLPGFTMKDTVTEISGRGVGLDVVQNMVKAVRGTVRVSTHAGRGTRFQLHLPLTLSVLRTLLVEVAGEPYAIPLTQIAHALRLTREQIETLEGRPFFRPQSGLTVVRREKGESRQQSSEFSTPIGLVAASQVLDCGPTQLPENGLSVVVLGDRVSRYGLIVDRFLGERELVVQPLDSRLGKVNDISAAALMEDGSPVLIVDVDDMVRSIEKLVSAGALTNVSRGTVEAPPKKRKRVLAVDDSLTVRELERKLLVSRGYVADVAVDGMDGWNAVQSGVYDLVITDVDMPRMDGIELATLIKRDAQLKSLPVMIVSYKDREEDRLRGLEAGADYYLTKGSFHDETLLQAVQDLIGEAEQ